MYNQQIKENIMKKMLLVSFLVILSTNLFSQIATAPSTGDGSEGNPYQIANLENLYWIAADTLNIAKYYIQTADIDASETRTWFAGSGWLPIGNANNYFIGNYDGKGHVIDSLFVNRESENYIGLFGYIYSSTIKDIGVRNIDLTALDNIGAIAGYTELSSISNTYSSGFVDGNNNVGGLIGFNSEYSMIANSYSLCDVTGVENIGGLNGYSYSAYTIYSYSIGEVIGANNTGGLIGYGQYDDMGIYSCFWDFETSNQFSSWSGVGLSTLEMKNILNYINNDWDFNNTWGIDKDYNNGYPYLRWQGLPSPLIVATHDVTEIRTTSAKIEFEIVSLGEIDIVQHGVCWSTIENPSIDDGTTEEGIVDSVRTFVTEMTNLESNTIYYVKSYATNSDSTVYGNQISFTSLPIEPIQPIGSGTLENPYKISSLNNLFWINEDSNRWENHYQQISDIDASTTSNWFPDGKGSSYGWKPISIPQNDFEGYYDGSNFTINGLGINRPNEDYVGLFAICRAEIKNLNLTNVNIVGRYYVGSLIGTCFQSSKTISNCYSSGIVNGSKYVGGLIGKMGWSQITNCMSKCTVAGIENIGGLIGENGTNSEVYLCYSESVVSGNKSVGGLIGKNNQSQLSNCYSRSTVEGVDNIGGLVGENYYSAVYGFIISNCYSSGTVNGTGGNIGGLIGDNNSDKVENSFWDIETSDQVTSDGGIGLTTIDMKTHSTFTDSTWDFIGETTNGSENIWDIDGVTNSGYPFLAWQTTGIDEDKLIVPKEITLHQNYPNPFNPTTTISFSTYEIRNVKLSIFNSNGQLVQELVNKKLSSGNHSVLFDAQDLNSGIYFYTLEVDDKRLSNKMLLIK
jgi:hypothetical protein